jgi:hypothetical protein
MICCTLGHFYFVSSQVAHIPNLPPFLREPRSQCPGSPARYGRGGAGRGGRGQAHARPGALAHQLTGGSAASCKSRSCAAALARHLDCGCARAPLPHIPHRLTALCDHCTCHLPCQVARVAPLPSSPRAPAWTVRPAQTKTVTTSPFAASPPIRQMTDIRNISIIAHVDVSATLCCACVWGAGCTAHACAA